MAKGIASVDEKEKEISILKRGIGELEKRMERLEKEFTSVRNASEKLSSHMKALRESALALIKKVHEFE